MTRAVAVLFALAAPLAACHRTDCGCTDPPSVTIDAPGGAIATVKASGPACDGVLPACSGTTADSYPPGCPRTFLFARHEGACDVEIDMQDGTVIHKSITLVAHPIDCCQNITPRDPAEGQIAIAPPDAGQG